MIGTICSLVKDGKYENANLFPERIAKINRLFLDGHKIIYFTSRGMGRFNNDFNKAYETFYEFTKKQLMGWGVYFSDLKFRKIII